MRDSTGRFLKGNHVKTEFKKGRVSNRKGVKLSEDTKLKISINSGMRGKPSWSYLDGRSKNPIVRKTVKGSLKSHFVWCSQPENLSYVPKGFVIHHIDLNPLNDSPDNLFLMTDRDHRVYHVVLTKELVR